MSLVVCFLANLFRYELEMFEVQVYNHFGYSFLIKFNNVSKEKKNDRIEIKIHVLGRYSLCASWANNYGKMTVKGIKASTYQKLCH